MAEKSKYLILCANVAHPSGELKYFLLVDDDDNTFEFKSREEAASWCKENDDRPLAYVILSTDEFEFE